MPGLKPARVDLTDAEQQGLEQWVRRHSTRQPIGLRARVVLQAAAGKNNAELAQALSMSIDVVRRWRRRGLTLQPMALTDLRVAERLEDLPRPGAPPRLTADPIGRIEEVACEQPETSGRPISPWTGREMAEELIPRGSVERISARHASRWLKKGASNPTGSVTG